jgi:hypothetical protein
MQGSDPTSADRSDGWIRIHIVLEDIFPIKEMGSNMIAHLAQVLKIRNGGPSALLHSYLKDVRGS